ncbi:GNAT family N-acetyltransferase [Streptomyces durbertensis]|uniref:GNAT family N-acetyltransferase n=1 Tax=Streptomyces durbertensis TaxID=2448886 RepID=UPI002B20BDDB|nr:GNAT family N-acyltransferase [Streptomyces durbertensis]
MEPAGRYRVQLATEESQVRAAQRLRHQVFAHEWGARLSGGPGLDVDWFDNHCDHLLVVENITEQVVGTYRLLPPERARVAGHLYSEQEFDLTRLAGIRPDLVEAGRSCVHPDHRDGAVISLMWAGIARYLLAAGHNWLAGCCSVPLADGGAMAGTVWRRTAERHLASEEFHVVPRRPWPVADAADRADGQPLPALLRGYLRLGARVCGPPAHDPEFGVADFFVLLSVRDMNPRYLRHFLGLLDQ